MPRRPTVILVHGLWMHGLELGALKSRLRRQGFDALTYSYSSVTGTMAQHVAGLRDFVRTLKCEQLHFVGHSLGGLVVCRFLEQTNDVANGRAVLLGTPLQGCVSARGFARLPFARALLGRAMNEEVLNCTPRSWSGRRELGVIAGSMGLGLGRLFTHLQADHDGSILVEETRFPGAIDHIVLPVSHTGMVFSAQVAEQTAQFLREGRFRHCEVFTSPGCGRGRAKRG